MRDRRREKMREEVGSKNKDETRREMESKAGSREDEGEADGGGRAYLDMRFLPRFLRGMKSTNTTDINSSLFSQQNPGKKIHISLR